MKRLSKLVVVLVGAVMTLSVAAVPASAFSGSDLPALAARDYAKAQWPGEYSGFWVSYVTPPSFGGDALPDDARFHFAFTDDAEAKVEILRDMFPGTNPYVSAEHEFSMSQLLTVHAQAVADLKLIGDGVLDAPGDPVDHWSVGIADDKNRAMVGVPVANATPAFKAWALDRWGVAAEVNGELPSYPSNMPPPVEEPQPAEEPHPGVGGGDGGSTEAAIKPALKKQKALVKKCNRAAKSRSASRKRFSKSRKCKRARRAVRASAS